MRRFRNPRYAPEALERKLHPSGFTLPVTAEYASATHFSPTPTTGGIASPANSHPIVSSAVCVRAVASADPTPPAPPTPTPTPKPWEPLGEPQCPDDPNCPA